MPSFSPRIPNIVSSCTPPRERSFQTGLADHRRIVLLTDGFSTPFLAKTAISLLRYRTADVAALIANDTEARTCGQLFGVGDDIPVVPGLDSVAAADALYIGIAPPGGKLPEAWLPVIRQAIERGFDVVSGLHDFLTDDAALVTLAAKHQVRLVDVRRNRFLSTAQGGPLRRQCIRIHAVGHDCSIGKMVAAYELAQGLKAAGHHAKFLATGQTGIMISGEGVPIDCVVADFVNGAAETLVRESDDHDFVLIEGQGSLTHPAYSAVTMGLLHGCAPDGLIFVYEAGRTMVKGFDKIAIPDMKKQLQLILDAANFRHPCRLIAVAVNCCGMTDQAAAEEVRRAEASFGVPACDVYRQGAEKLVRAAEHLRQAILTPAASPSGGSA